MQRHRDEMLGVRNSKQDGLARSERAKIIKLGGKGRPNSVISALSDNRSLKKSLR